MRWAALGIIGVLVSSVAGCTVDDAGDTAGKMEGNLIGGTVAGPKFTAVGALADEMSGPFCTATLVAPRFIITAQHCIEGGGEDNPEDRVAEQVLFELGDDAGAPKRVVRLKQWLRAPSFETPGYEPPNHYASDVMLAELAEPVEDDISPIPVSFEALTDAEIGREFDVVGFGVRSEDGRGEVEGKRETGSFKLEATEGNAFVKRFGSRDEFQTYYATIDPDGANDGVGDRMFTYGELNAGYNVLARSETSETCFGDSGGPFMRRRGTKLEVVGVVSTGFPGYASSCLHLGTVFATFGPRTSAFLQQHLGH